jgi:hypothetical protein
VVRGDGLVDRLAQVVPDVPAIRDLGSLRRPGAGAVGVGAGPVPAHDLDAGVGAQPVGDRVGVAAGQHVDRPVGAHVEHDGAVHMPTP